MNIFSKFKGESFFWNNIWPDLKESLNYMWQGMLAIFVVIAVIILSVYAVGYITEKIEKAKAAKADAEADNDN